MKRPAVSIAIPLLLLLHTAAQAGDDVAADPLFTSSDILEVRLVAPFDVIASDRPTDEDIPGKLYVAIENGEKIAFDVGIRTRGRFRLNPDICAFPPLRLNFKKSQLNDSLFDGQDKLKLVTHCRHRSQIYEQNMLVEYLAYRILNLMTDYSFRVRLLNVNYANHEADNGFQKFAFVIEHKNRLATRIGIPILSVASTTASSLDAVHSNLTSVYQYLIGNTDFASTAGPPGTECCHNYVLFGSNEGPYYSIPYDFDMSGIVNAPYATPNPKIQLNSVEERLYRGFCINNALLPDTLEQFHSKRGEIESLIRGQPGLSSSSRKSMLRYINQFYSKISSERSVNRFIVATCR